MKLKELPEVHQKVIVSALLSCWASGGVGDLIEDADYDSDKISEDEVINLLTTYRAFIETADSDLLENTLEKALADTKIDL